MTESPQRPVKREEQVGTRIVYRVQAKGLPGCLMVSILFLILAVALLIFLVLGVITAIFAAWIASGLILFAVLTGMLRRRR